MEKILKNIFTIICVLVMTASFTSCDGDNNDPYTYYYYNAEGTISSISSSLDDLDALFAIAEYNEAIAKLFAGNVYVMGKHDSEVIKACDEVYKRHQEKHPSWQGYVKIRRSRIDDNGDLFETEVLKEYNYQPKK